MSAPGDQNALTIRGVGDAFVCSIDLLGVKSRVYERAGLTDRFSHEVEAFLETMREAVNLALEWAQTNDYRIYAFTDTIYLAHLKNPDLLGLLKCATRVQAFLLSKRFGSRAFCTRGTLYSASGGNGFETFRGSNGQLRQFITPIGTSIARIVELERISHGHGWPMGLFLDRKAFPRPGVSLLSDFLDVNLAMVNQKEGPVGDPNHWYLMERCIRQQIFPTTLCEHAPPFVHFLRCHGETVDHSAATGSAAQTAT